MQQYTNHYDTNGTLTNSYVQSTNINTLYASGAGHNEDTIPAGATIVEVTSDVDCYVLLGGSSVAAAVAGSSSVSDGSASEYVPAKVKTKFHIKGTDVKVSVAVGAAAHTTLAYYKN